VPDPKGSTPQPGIARHRLDLLWGMSRIDFRDEGC
jgi:hypothetical protein